VRDEVIDLLAHERPRPRALRGRQAGPV
jgi:hypothetical protein